MIVHLKEIQATVTVTVNVSTEIQRLLYFMAVKEHIFYHNYSLKKNSC